MRDRCVESGSRVAALATVAVPAGAASGGRGTGSSGGREWRGRHDIDLAVRAR